METVLQSIHFRKIFYLLCIIAVIALFAIRYTVFPTMDRRESWAKRTLRHLIDTLIGLIIAAMALGGIAFWISGNE